MYDLEYIFILDYASFRICLETTILVSVRKALPVATVKLLLVHVLIHPVKMVLLVLIFVESSFVVVRQDGPVLLAISRSDHVMESTVSTVSLFL